MTTAQRSLKVAVIGAGTAGLVTARELQREGHRVVIFEKAAEIGGTWKYNPEIESDPLGIDPNRKIVHSSLYSSLRTNLPRHLMGFSDYPFNVKKNGELNNFPGHEEVLKFLNNFARDFGIFDLIRFNTEAVRIERENGEENNQWIVEWRGNDDDDEENKNEVFEAVVICNGHYTQPKVPQLPGIRNWAGKQIHSHNYRVPEPYGGQVVVVIGAGPSAYDISQDICKVAKQVHLSSRSNDVKISKLSENVWQHSEVEYCYENGEVGFKDGALVAADIILYCTGYKYEYPFLKTNGIVRVDDNRVGPLYKHIFPPQLAPALSFIGITFHAVIFLMIELQAKWVAHVLSGKTNLPSQQQMLDDTEQHYRRLEANGTPKHQSHSLRGIMFEYLDWLSIEAGGEAVDDNIKHIYEKYIESIASSYPWIGSSFRELDIHKFIK